MSSEAKILGMHISDHAAVQLKFSILEGKIHTRVWSFSRAWLADPAFQEEIRAAIKEYFRINRIEDMASWALWEAFKASVRASITSFSTVIEEQKQRKARLTVLEEQIRAGERLWQRQPNANINE